MMAPFDPFEFVPYFYYGLPFEALPQEEPPPPPPPKSVFEQILEDIRQAPIESWEWHCDFGYGEKAPLYYRFDRKNRYSLHGAINEANASITMLELSNNDYFSKEEQAILKDELKKLLERLKKYEAKERADRDVERLREIFPRCKV